MAPVDDNDIGVARGVFHILGNPLAGIDMGVEKEIELAAPAWVMNCAFAGVADTTRASARLPMSAFAAKAGFAVF